MASTRAIDLSHHLSEEAKSRSNEQIKAAFKYFKDPNIVSLGGGLPLPDLFPFNSIEIDSLAPPFPHGIEGPPKSDSDKLKIKLEKYDLDHENDIPLSVSLQYGASFGHPTLNEFLKSHTQMIHHPKYEDWDLILTVGNTQGWDSTLRTFTQRGDTILAEKFTFSSAAECAKANGLTIVPVEVDLEGIIPEALDKQLQNWKGKRPNLLYTIPSGQNPTGSTLSSERRRAVYQLAKKYDFIIVEDEPYYFLQMETYSSRRAENNESKHLNKAEFLKSLVPSYLSLDEEGRVVRLDSFSKVLAPGSRVGWIIAQKGFTDKYLRQHDVTIQIACGFAQSIINGLLQRWGQDGYLQWLIELRRAYTRKRDLALDAVEKFIPKEVSQWIPPTAGMFFWIKFDATKHPLFYTKFNSSAEELELHIYNLAIKNGVLMIPGHWFLIRNNTQSLTSNTDIYFRGTFASVPEDKLSIGLERFGKVIKEEFELN